MEERQGFRCFDDSKTKPAGCFNKRVAYDLFDPIDAAVRGWKYKFDDVVGTIGRLHGTG
ncbi:hypothetical protein D3C81_2231510 [compost metagenome]|jgi:hypothetical protein